MLNHQLYNLSCQADQVFPRPTLTLYRYKAGPLEDNNQYGAYNSHQPILAGGRQFAHRSKLAATLLRQEPLPGTQTQLTLNLIHQPATKQPLHLINNGVVEDNLQGSTATSLEVGSNDIFLNNNNNDNNQQANDLSLVYGISSWALVDESSLSSNVITQFECLLVVDGATGYEQRQSLALQRGKFLFL